MVTVFLRGGLGNQMFQYAAGLELAKKRNEDLFLDEVFLDDRFPRKEFTYRVFDLDIFSIEPRLTILSKISKKFPIPGFWFVLDFFFIYARRLLGMTYFLKEGDKRSPENFSFKDRGNVVMWGFWQSQKYFNDVENEVRAAFKCRNPLEGEAAVLGKQIAASSSVAIHVRRGDYLLAKYAKLYAGTDLSYYDRAVEYILGKIESPYFFVFSDDIAWCKENLKLPARATVTYVDASSSGPKASYHLELMSLCRHNIIANSTFSWWGAWLNANPKKIVIAPKHWYVGNEAGSHEIIPEDWIKL